MDQHKHHLQEPRDGAEGKGWESWEQLAGWVPPTLPSSAQGKVASLRQERGQKGHSPGLGKGAKEFSHPGFSLSCSPRKALHLLTFLMWSRTRGRQAVTLGWRTGGSCTGRGQQVWLQVKQPAWGSRLSALEGRPSRLHEPWLPCSRGRCAEPVVNSSSPSAWHTPRLASFAAGPCPLLHRGKHVFPRPHGKPLP